MNLQRKIIPSLLMGFITLLLAFGNIQAQSTTNSYSVISEIPVGGAESYYVQITGAPDNAIIANVEAKFDYIAYGVVQDYVSARFNRGSDPGASGGAILVSQGNLPEGNPGTYGWIAFNNWDGQSVNSNYYFRFAVAAGSPFTATINTIYVRITYILPGPSLLSPPNGYEIIQGAEDVTFDWANETGASYYEIWIDNHSGFGSPEIGFNNGQSNDWINDGIVSSSQFTFSTTMQNQLPQNLYYWKVRALNSAQEPITAWSSPWDFTLLVTPPPTLESPPDGYEIIQGAEDVTFDWTNVTGASYYEIWIDNHSGFGSPEVGFNNGQSNDWIDDGIVSSSQFTFSTTMQNQLPQNLYYWKVRALNSAQEPITAWSLTRNFTIAPVVTPTITVTYPNGGETLYKGTDYNITWNSSDVSGNVKIEVYKGGSFYYQLGANEPNDGSYPFNPPTDWTDGSDYQVAVATLDGSVSDFSDGNFTIRTVTPPSITVTYPNGGETLYKDTDYNITWTSSDVSGNVKIEVYKGGSFHYQLGANEPNDGEYPFNPPADWTDGSDYKIAVATLDGNVSDFSDGSFTITTATSPSITVTYPDGGEILYKGTDYDITWNSSDVSGNVKIEVYKGGSFYQQLGANEPNDGEYPFNPPTDWTDGSDYQVAVATLDGSVSDFSDGNFTIESSQSYVDDYPYPSQDYNLADPWLFYYRECTSYAAFKINQDAGTLTEPYFFTNYMNGGHWGNAGNWASNAASLGYIVDNNPGSGSIAQWNAGELGDYGHVAYVEDVNQDGSVNLTEYNYQLEHNFSQRLNVFNIPRFIHISPQTVIDEKQSIVLCFSLQQNFPNPFNPTTSIIYSLPTKSKVDIKIFDLLGKEVITLINDEQEAKHYKVIWDAKDRSGNSVPSGMYLYRIVAKSGDRTFVKTRKLLLMR